jgi:hypothetical protein
MEPRFIPAPSFKFSVPKPIRLGSQQAEGQPESHKVIAPGIGGLQ